MRADIVLVAENVLDFYGFVFLESPRLRCKMQLMLQNVDNIVIDILLIHT